MAAALIATPAPVSPALEPKSVKAPRQKQRQKTGLPVNMSTNTITSSFTPSRNSESSWHLVNKDEFRVSNRNGMATRRPSQILNAGRWLGRLLIGGDEDCCSPRDIEKDAHLLLDYDAEIWGNTLSARRDGKDGGSDDEVEGGGEDVRKVVGESQEQNGEDEEGDWEDEVYDEDGDEQPTFDDNEDGDERSYYANDDDATQDYISEEYDVEFEGFDGGPYVESDNDGSVLSEPRDTPAGSLLVSTSAERIPRFLARVKERAAHEERLHRASVSKRLSRNLSGIERSIYTSGDSGSGSQKGKDPRRGGLTTLDRSVAHEEGCLLRPGTTTPYVDESQWISNRCTSRCLQATYSDNGGKSNTLEEKPESAFAKDVLGALRDVIDANGGFNNQQSGISGATTPDTNHGSFLPEPLRPVKSVREPLKPIDLERSAKRRERGAFALWETRDAIEEALLKTQDPGTREAKTTASSSMSAPVVDTYIQGSCVNWVAGERQMRIESADSAKGGAVKE